MIIRSMMLAAVGLTLGAAPAIAERQQQAEIKKVDCHATFAAFDDGEDGAFQPIDTKSARKARPRAKAGGSPRGTPLRPCIVLASA